MNRRQKIILSITGIFLVILMLLGLTYAYFLTQITGNTNPKSISVTTKNLSLTYDDGDGSILSSDTKLVPSSNAINTKTFKVINNGDATDYVVILDNVNVTVAGTTTQTTFKTNDFVYTLICKTKDNSDCSNQINNQTPLPLENNGLLIGNDIKENDEHTYTLTLWYLDNGSNQSDDMNKSLNARINIEDIGRINPYSDNTNSLAYNIINNSLLETNGTQLLAYPPTKVAKEFSSDNLDTTLATYTYYNPILYSKNYFLADDCISGIPIYNEETGDYEFIKDCTGITKIEDNPKCEDFVPGFVYDETFGTVSFAECHNGKPVRGKMAHEKVLSVTQDNYGTSYYFRGNPMDNYVEFNNMCWRIVRIEGDGSVKLVLQKQEECAKESLYDSEGATIGYGNYGTGNETFRANDWIGYLSDRERPDYENSTDKTSMKYAFEEWFNGKLRDGTTPIFSESVKTKIKNTKICLGDNNTMYDNNGNVLTKEYLIEFAETWWKEHDYVWDYHWYYNNYLRIAKNKEASLICNDNALSKNKYQVYTLTADEVLYAGGKYIVPSSNQTPGDLETINYLDTIVFNNNGESIGWWTLSISQMSDATKGINFLVSNNGASLIERGVASSTMYSGYRPAISLIEGIEITEGDGTKSNPYKIKVS